MSEKQKFSLKKALEIDKTKVLTSLLAGFSVPFVLCICASMSVYLGNYREFTFQPQNFLPIFALGSLAVFAFITICLLLTKGILRSIGFCLCVYAVTAGFIQTVITNLTFKGLPGDGNVAPVSKTQIIINAVAWILLFAVIIFFGVIWKKRLSAQKVMSFVLILIMVMETASILPSAVSYAGTLTADAQSENSNVKYYLTTENMFELSEKNNTVLFIIDRFDRDYFYELLEAKPEYADKLHGFTFYDDNISSYPRTYPGVTSMLTGIHTDFSTSRGEYFDKAYSESVFLKDLVKNDYKVNLFIPYYYTYENADVLKDIAANVAEGGSYQVVAPKLFLKNMIELSTYFWLPDAFKSQTISSNSFTSIVTLDGDKPGYIMDQTSDPEVYKDLLSQGLTTQNRQNTFTVLHLRGAHAPYTMDENSNPVEKNSVSSIQQTEGCFKIVCEYMEQMKAIGVYDDATIIITGDHGEMEENQLPLPDEFLTALLVKTKGSGTAELTYSQAPVSQNNLHAEIVKSEGITTSHDYGDAYSDVPEDAVLTRNHYFQTWFGNGKKNESYVYEITGSGLDFDNWKIISQETVDPIFW